MTRLTLRFQTRHPNPYWLRLAQQGDYVSEPIGSLTMHSATFDAANPLHLSPAISLSTALVHEKKAEATVNGNHVSLAMVRAVLLCYEQSWHVGDVRAFCWATVHVGEAGLYSLTLPDTARPLLPCRLASHRAGMIRPSNPAPLAEQIKAVVVAAETYWCPRLQQEDAWPLQIQHEREA